MKPYHRYLPACVALPRRLGTYSPHMPPHYPYIPACLPCFFKYHADATAMNMRLRISLCARALRARFTCDAWRLRASLCYLS